MARKRDRDDETPEQGWGAPTLGGSQPEEPGQHGLPGAAPLAPGGPASSQPGRARTWLVLLVSFVVQLAAVLAVGNTGVVDSATRFRADHDDTLGAFATIPAVFSWRLTPPSSDPSHLYAAELAGLLTLVVVAALLSLALVRGPVTFWRAFVGVALAVLAATLANGMVRRIVLDDLGRYDEVGGKAAGVLFQSGGPEIVGGALLGLLAGLIAAIVAVVSRRPEAVVLPAAAPEAAPYVEPAAPPPWHGDGPAHPAEPAMAPQAPAQPAPARPAPSLRKDDDGQATTRLPAVAPAVVPSARTDTGADQQTTAFRRPDVAPRDEPVRDEPVRDEPVRDEPVRDEPVRDEPARDEPHADSTEQATQALPAQPSAQPSAQPTQAFPRPPDDEDFGHHPDDD